MAWLVVNGDGKEFIFEVKPKRSKQGEIWQLPSRYSLYSLIYLGKGIIEKIIGRRARISSGTEGTLENSK